MPTGMFRLGHSILDDQDGCKDGARPKYHARAGARRVGTEVDRVTVFLVLSLPLHVAAACSTLLPSLTGMACMSTLLIICARFVQK
jgi:hypothetical protein